MRTSSFTTVALCHDTAAWELQLLIYAPDELRKEEKYSLLVSSGRKGRWGCSDYSKQ